METVILDCPICNALEQETIPIRPPLFFFVHCRQCGWRGTVKREPDLDMQLAFNQFQHNERARKNARRR